MQPLLFDLLELLRYELEKYYELLKILYAERSLLVERKVKELEVLIKEEETTIQKIQRIEITRDELLTELSTELEIGDHLTCLNWNSCTTIQRSLESTVKVLRDDKFMGSTG